MSSSTLTSKGQTTIPADVRALLKLRPGDRLEFIVQDDGKALMMPIKLTLDDLKGILPKPKKRASLKDIERTIRMRGSRKGRKA